MKRCLTILLVAMSGLCPPTPAIGDCVCDKVPMYPMGGGGNWYHYATVHRTSDCAYLYATGHIAPPSTGETCAVSPACGTCSSLGVGDAGKIAGLFYGADGSTAVSYDSVDTPEKAREFLKTNSPPGSNTDLYDNLDFIRPFSTTYPKAIVVKLTRQKESETEEFYAIVWRIRGSGPMNKPGARAFVGFEVAGEIPNGVARIKPMSEQCNAVSTSTDESGNPVQTPVPGLLQVRFSSFHEDTVYIRLHNSEVNKSNTFPPCH